MVHALLVEDSSVYKEWMIFSITLPCTTRKCLALGKLSAQKHSILSGQLARLVGMSGGF